MKTKYFIFAASALVALASCSNEEYIGDNSLTSAEGDGSIQFSYEIPNATRAQGDTYGAAAAEKLGNYFYVVGTKGTEGTNNPSENLVFDNYSVVFEANTAGTTASNTANWEYAGKGADANHVKLSPNAQTIKYWDYGVARYDFHAFSTGTKKAVSGTPADGTEIGVTKSKYGAGLASSATAYTFDVPNAECLSNIYITDITPVKSTGYGKDVQLKFKNLGAKIRIALYETVPGYSIQAGSVKFYASTTTPTNPATGGYVPPTTTGTLISTADKGLPVKGTIAVKFPNVGSSNFENANYNKASVDVTADETAPANYVFTKTFGTIDKTEMVSAEANEVVTAVSAGDPVPADYESQVGSAAADATLTAEEAALYNAAISYYIGHSLPNASFVGDPNADFYQLVFPVDDSHPLTLKVDYKLISTDGSGETIDVHGATAVIPSTYTKWQPNYAYTYIFKISDNTNGTTDYATEGLFPITFDAYVADFTDVSGEQKTITTVATPSITTYQQNHDITKDEYVRGSKNIYVQVKKANGSLATDLSGETGDGTDRSILFSVAAGTTEAKVMDALQQRTTAINAANVTGRNGLTLTKGTITNNVTSIVNGVDDKAITVSAGTTGQIAATTAAGTYAYVYDYSAAAKTVVDEFQPVAVTLTPTPAQIDGTDKEYYTLTTAALGASPAEVLAAAEAVNSGYVYFSKTTTDGVNYTYSYISVAGKATVPAGTVKYPKASITSHVPGTTVAAANTFYFDKFFSNNGAYAVKVIKIVD